MDTKLFSIKRDFTFTKYIELCRKMLSSDYSLLTVEQYFTTGNKPDKFVIMRHDVDDGADLPYTLAMARREGKVVKEKDILATRLHRFSQNTITAITASKFFGGLLTEMRQAKPEVK